MSGQIVAIVIPWFGRDQRGGAERHAWELATRLAARKHSVEVITTCCRSHQDDWATNHLPSGVSHEPEGFTVRRFPVVARDRQAFDRVNSGLTGLSRASLRRGLPPVGPDEETVFADDLMRSPDLLEHLRRHAAEYRVFLFIPYLYFTTLRGLPLVSDKAMLIPCLHHEPYAYLSCVADVFRRARRILFISEGELRLASWLFGPGITVKGSCAGGGIEFPDVIPSDGSIDIEALTPFVLCLGRQDSGKNTDFLARAYAAYRERFPETELKLVLAGPGSIGLPSDSGVIINLGSISDAAKLELLESCEALFNPSTNESYSRVIMEAWHSGRPVVVHRDCLATATAVSQGENGWIAAGAEEWIHAFHRVAISTGEELARMGENGRKHASELADWDRAIARYEAAIREFDADPRSSPIARRGSVDQVLPNMASGDAISNQAIWIRRFLRREGYGSEIYAMHIDPNTGSEARQWKTGCIESKNAIIYHHSIGTSLTAEVCNHPAPKALIYHNITPHNFLADYLPLNNALCREARARLPSLAKFFPISAGDSIYNAIELSECSFQNPEVLPLCVDPARWNMRPDQGLMDKLQDGRTNILFVGRLSPNKRQEDLIIAFAHYRKLDPAARLHLVGAPMSSNDLYESCLRALAGKLGIVESVNFAGMVDDSCLAAYYLTANLFWSMSEHEGFCVPLIEAMWFDVPVMAYAACAVPETMGESGSLFASKADPEALARQAFDLVHDSSIREPVLSRQRARRGHFLPHRVEAHLRRLVAKLELQNNREPSKTLEYPALERVREIAVVKLDHIGDVLLASPVFFSLAMRFPGARITAVVAPSSAPVLVNNPYVGRVVAYDPPWYWRKLEETGGLRSRIAQNWEAMEELTAEPFDLVVNLRSDHTNVLFSASLPHRYLLSYTNDSPFAFLVSHPLTRTRPMHVTQQHRELLRSIGADLWCEPTVYFSNDSLARAESLGSPNERTVALALGAGIPLKRWAPVKFRELARRLRERGFPVAIVGAAADARLSENWAPEYGCLDLCGRLDLHELAAYLSRVGCLVANDSAPMHIAAAAKIPVVYITRPPVYDEFRPVGFGHIGCVADRCENPCKGFDPDDRTGTPEFCRCIQSITVEQVERAVLNTMEKARHPESARSPVQSAGHDQTDSDQILSAALPRPK
jgi:glycosyltransferase involved in cell wall biosynthesis/ADP-heptose:LPS heptosyltransferase